MHNKFQPLEKNEMKVAKIAVLAGILAFASTSAFAAEVPKFEKADANGDSFVDATEFAAATAAGVKKTVAELDKSGDGKLNKDEYSVILEEECD